MHEGFSQMMHNRFGSLIKWLWDCQHLLSIWQLKNQSTPTKGQSWSSPLHCSGLLNTRGTVPGKTQLKHFRTIFQVKRGDSLQPEGRYPSPFPGKSQKSSFSSVYAASNKSNFRIEIYPCFVKGLGILFKNRHAATEYCPIQVLNLQAIISPIQKYTGI